MNYLKKTCSGMQKLKRQLLIKFKVYEQDYLTCLDYTYHNSPDRIYEWCNVYVRHLRCDLNSRDDDLFSNLYMFRTIYIELNAPQAPELVSVCHICP
jgi:hypothetical protein